ncbi:MAG: enoyl-CoA hydratase/isomerase family protein [Roseovarius sp.]
MSTRMRDGYETLNVRVAGNLGWAELNRPLVLNAMNLQCIRELQAAIEAFDADPEIRVVAIVGAGERAFTAGADITEIHDYGQLEMEHYNRHWLSLFETIEGIRKPVIAAAHGWATGGGTEMSLACDFVLCTEAARFGLAEINIGVIPGAGAAVRLTRWVGRLKAKEILMLGRTLTGPEAVSVGLANRCVATRDDLLAEVRALADELASKAPLALAAAKASVNIAAEADQRTGIEHELNEFLRLFATEDQKEGMRAFLEKRAPVYTGR